MRNLPRIFGECVQSALQQLPGWYSWLCLVIGFVACVGGGLLFFVMIQLAILGKVGIVATVIADMGLCLSSLAGFITTLVAGNNLVVRSEKRQKPEV